MLLKSTRGAGAVTAPEAILKGIAEDGGLYYPDSVPRVSFRDMIHDDYMTAARKVLTAFLPGYTEDEIAECVKSAYTGTFDDPAVVPVRYAGETPLVELFHGPTAAFKDCALSILPRLMEKAVRKTGFDKKIQILTATSGDTGSAALSGFKNIPGIDIAVFYPERGISPIQRAQMTRMDGENIRVCGVRGNFDDAQTAVKKIFTEFPRDILMECGKVFSSANSINFGRLAPQIVYYFTTYLALCRDNRVKPGDPVSFCVPTGNFGDILAGYLARKAGLPIGKLICASNRNRVLTDFFETGVYQSRRPFYVTSSPSMDILISSNLERLVYDAAGQDAVRTAELMRVLKETGTFALSDREMAFIRKDFAAACVTDAEGAEAIGRVYGQYGYVMDPHTAVAYRALEKYREATGDTAVCAVLSTASPFKFPAAVLPAIGSDVPEDMTAQLETLSRKAGLPVPGSLYKAVTGKDRFNDTVAPCDMFSYVERLVRTP